MRFLHTAFWLAIGISPAFARRAPVIVIPGRPDVPVLAPPPLARQRVARPRRRRSAHPGAWPTI